MLGGIRLQLIFVVEEGDRRGTLLDVFGPLQLLNSSHVRERDKALLRSVMVGERIRPIGPGVCFGMAGFLCFQVLMVPLFGRC